MEILSREDQKLIFEGGSKTLEEFELRLLSPPIDFERREKIDTVFKEYKEDLEKIQRLEEEAAEFSMEEVDNDEPSRQAAAELAEELYTKLSQAKEEAAATIAEALYSRGILDINTREKFRYRTILYRSGGRGNVDMNPPQKEPPARIHLTPESLYYFALHEKDLITSRELVLVALSSVGVDAKTLDIEFVYIPPPEDNFFSERFVRERRQGTRPGNIVPDILQGETLCESSIYKDVLFALSRGLRVGALPVCLSPELEQWAQRPETALRPPGAFRDLIMAQMHEFLSKRNMVCTQANLDTLFAQFATREALSEQELSQQLASLLADGEVELMRHRNALDTCPKSSFISATANNPFSAMVVIWEKGMAPVMLGKDTFGIAFTPFQNYPKKPDDMHKGDMALASLTASAREAADAPENQQMRDIIAQGLRRMILGDGFRDDDDE